jgi:hypothetical protein
MGRGGRLVIALAAGAVAGAAAFTAFGLYGWTAMHSGLSQTGMNLYYAAAVAMPLALGILAAWGVYRALDPRRRGGPSAGPML